jgi:hypothetical protein
LRNRDASPACNHPQLESHARRAEHVPGHQRDVIGRSHTQHPSTPVHRDTLRQRLRSFRRTSAQSAPPRIGRRSQHFDTNPLRPSTTTSAFVPPTNRRPFTLPPRDNPSSGWLGGVSRGLDRIDRGKDGSAPRGRDQASVGRLGAELVPRRRSEGYKDGKRIVFASARGLD